MVTVCRSLRPGGWLLGHSCRVASLYRQDRLYSASMYTDDLWLLALEDERMHRLLTALYLTKVNLGLIFAGESKMAIGTGLRIIGGSLFVMLAIVAIPAQKILNALDALSKAASGKLKLCDYEKLLGLLVHCLFLVYMDSAMLDDLWDPIGHAKHRGCSMASLLDPNKHPAQAATWLQWRDALSSRSAAMLSVVLPCTHPELTGMVGAHVWSDAFRDEIHPDPGGIRAGLGGMMEGFWWHYAVPSDEAQWLKIPALEGLATGASLLTFDAAGVLPPPAMPLMLHGDGLAILADLVKHRVPNKTMRFIKHQIEALPMVRDRMHHLAVVHDFGLRNGGGDAASRLRIDRIVCLCRNLGRRPVRCPVPSSVVQLVKAAAKHAEAVCAIAEHYPAAKRRTHETTW